MGNTSWRVTSFSALIVFIAYAYIEPGASFGQTINIDLGDGGGGDGDYVGTAASGQGGTWNYINDPMNADEEIPLVNANGADTGVTFVALSNTQVFDPGEATEDLVDPDLMGDIHWNNPGAVTTYEIRGLEPAQYSLFLYSYAGDVVNDDTIFTVNGESQTVAHKGALDPTIHLLGDTFALFFPVEPDAEGTISFDVDAGPGVPPAANFWQINGLQLGTEDPSGIAPTFVIDQPARGTDEFGCCHYDWTLVNTNPVISFGEWYLEIEAGLGGRVPECTGSDTVTVEGDWTAEFCYPWDLGIGPSAPSSRAVICFMGEELLPGDSISGTIALEANGEISFDKPAPPEITLPYDPPGNDVVPSRGVLLTVNKGRPDQPCETGAYNSHNGLSEGWGESEELVCLPEFLPVPSLSTFGKSLMLVAVSMMGVFLVRRSQLG